MCLTCGFYKGRIVIDMKAKHQARAERIKAKQQAIKAEQAEAASEAEQAPEQPTVPTTDNK